MPRKFYPSNGGRNGSKGRGSKKKTEKSRNAEQSSRTDPSRPSTHVYFQILSTGVEGSIPAIHLVTDRKRYMFNCCEGMQRLFAQRRLRLNKLSNFFFTRHSWSHIGGLPGFGLTLRDMKHTLAVGLNPHADADRKQLSALEEQVSQQQYDKANGFSGADGGRWRQMKKDMKRRVDEAWIQGKEEDLQVHLYAPQGMASATRSMEHFMKFDTVAVKFEVHECASEAIVCKDNEMTITAVPVGELTTSSMDTASDSRRSSSQQSPIRLFRVAPKTSSQSLCFVGELSNLRGKFLPDVADRLGVKVFQRNTLALGNPLTLDDGSVVTPDQVTGPEIPGPVFFILDCATNVQMASLIANKFLNSFVTGSSKKHPSVVVHLASELLCQSTCYQAWLEKFPSTTKHIFLHEMTRKDSQSIAFRKQYYTQCQLNAIHPTLFPKIEVSLEDVMIERRERFGIRDFENDDVKVDDERTDPTEDPKNFTIINLRSKSQAVVDNSDVQVPRSCRSVQRLVCKMLQESVERVIEQDGHKQASVLAEDPEAIDVPRKRQRVDSASDLANSVNYVRDDSPVLSAPETYPKVVCLGTGACIPSKYRNVSSTLVFVGAEKAVLLDCGEDTYGQLHRHYGAELENVLRCVKVIFISHLHADHHLGLVTLLKVCRQLVPNHEDEGTPLLIAPAVLLTWLKEYGAVAEHMEFRFLSSCSIPPNFVFRDIKLNTVPVKHPAKASGLILTHQGMKVTYSGDTMPCDALIKAGRDSLLLIHEATLEDDMLHEAVFRSHSTVSQALDVAKQMRAKHLILTHFSQRYPKIPTIQDANLAKHMALAFDHMELTLQSFSEFSRVLPQLNSLFAREEASDSLIDSADSEVACHKQSPGACTFEERKGRGGRSGGQRGGGRKHRGSFRGRRTSGDGVDRPHWTHNDADRPPYAVEGANRPHFSGARPGLSRLTGNSAEER